VVESETGHPGHGTAFLPFRTVATSRKIWFIRRWKWNETAGAIHKRRVSHWILTISAYLYLEWWKDMVVNLIYACFILDTHGQDGVSILEGRPRDVPEDAYPLWRTSSRTWISWPFRLETRICSQVHTLTAFHSFTMVSRRRTVWSSPPPPIYVHLANEADKVGCGEYGFWSVWMAWFWIQVILSAVATSPASYNSVAM